ncbi:hypothetical protein [Streptomyces clavuligerus]|uniref:hypothetical protein n=1 Tax=Streptomyces clavuligerus TaxID=1901 RepID=UPI00020D92CD|nr:hypothetical protein [Streptomyces clavuligerus]WDN56026.1 hypothetical protein LL058_29520 [Streptomyces clavuligerus]
MNDAPMPGFTIRGAYTRLPHDPTEPVSVHYLTDSTGAGPNPAAASFSLRSARRLADGFQRKRPVEMSVGPTTAAPFGACQTLGYGTLDSAGFFIPDDQPDTGPGGKGPLRVSAHLDDTCADGYRDPGPQWWRNRPAFLCQQTADLLREAGVLDREGPVEVTICSCAQELLPVRFREKGLSLALRRTSATPPGPRPALLAAMGAREAAIEGRDAQVDAFAVTHLGIPAARAAQWREAVSTALCTDWAEALDVPGEDCGQAVLGLIRRETLAGHRRLQPVWTRRTGGHRIHLLDKPVGTGVLADLIPGGRAPDEEALRHVLADPRVTAVLARLCGDESSVARIWSVSGETWRQAAIDAGLPPAYGERVRRKLKRLGAKAQP